MPIKALFFELDTITLFTVLCDVLFSMSTKFFRVNIFNAFRYTVPTFLTRLLSSLYAVSFCDVKLNFIDFSFNARGLKEDSDDLSGSSTSFVPAHDF